MLNDFYTHLCFSFFWGFCLTYFAFRFLSSLGFVDSPNSRSLHVKPTPTSGGIAIVLSLWISISHSPFLFHELCPWLLASSAFSVLGLIDDYKSRTVFFRLTFQFAIGGALIFWIIFNEESSTQNQLLFYFAALFLSVTLVAVVNLFNFMDGSDGLAGAQSLIYFLCITFMFDLLGLRSLTFLALGMSGVVLGFMIFNWPPAKIFMGDSGSYLLGSLHFAFGCSYYLSGNGISFPLILAAPFLCDSVLTLSHRFFTSQNWWQAHRGHCYQLLIMNGMLPRNLVLALITLHLTCTIPLAFLSFVYSEFSLYFLFATYLVISLIWYYLKRNMPRRASEEYA